MSAVAWSPSPQAGVVTGLLPSGETVTIEHSRARHWPGLAGEAPATTGLYRLARAKLGELSSVLDAGCGAAVGAAVLAEGCQRVVLADADPTAVRIAQSLAPRAEVLRADFASQTACEPVDAATVVDVLGHVRDTLGFLRVVRACLAPSGRLFAAEPVATPSQSLRAPARRAFSKRALESALTVAGFVVDEWLLDIGPFAACMAHLDADAASDAFAVAVDALARGLGERAAEALAKAKAASNPRLVLEATLLDADFNLALGRGDDAVRLYFEARRMDQSDARPVAGLARVSLACGDAAGAYELACTATRIDPVDPSAAVAAALAANGLEGREAFARWRLASNLSPDDAAIAIAASRAASSFGKHSLALHLLERVTTYDGDVPFELHVSLARAYAAAGRKEDAALSARTASVSAPDAPEVLELFAELGLGKAK